MVQVRFTTRCFEDLKRRKSSAGYPTAESVNVRAEYRRREVLESEYARLHC